MVDPRYRPGRRNAPKIAMLADWAAGLLIAILLTLIVAWLVSAISGRELASPQVMLPTLAFTWPLGSALGVWLSAGRPLTGSRFAHALGCSLLGGAVVTLPIWLALEPAGLQVAGGIAGLVLTPACARIGHSFARKREG